MNKRILLARPDAIGDFIIFSAVLEEYAKLYPEYDIDILCHPKVKDIVIAIPFIRKVYGLNPFKLNRKRYLPYLLYTLIKLNINRYEKVIYPVYSPLKEVDAFIKSIQAKEKIAFDGDVSNVSANDRISRSRIFSLLLKSDQNVKPEIDRNVEFLQKLGLNPKGELKSRFWFLPDDELEAQRLMHQEGFSQKKYICLFPGAGYEIKYWSSQNWIGLINELISAYPDYKIVVLGSGSDLKPIEEILSGLNKKEVIINLYGKTELRILAKVIEHSLVCIGMDTGSIHIAAALNIPNVCIMGGGHFGRFYPYGDLSRNKIVYHKMDCYGCNWQCIYDVTKCIKNIKVDDVFHEVGALMNASLAN